MMRTASAFSLLPSTSTSLRMERSICRSLPLSTNRLRYHPQNSIHSEAFRADCRVHPKYFKTCGGVLKATSDEQNDESSNGSKSITNNNIPDVQGVTLKMAFDTTYAVADASELKSERFTCPQSLDLVHYLRRNSDCVLVGKGTVVRDDCTLTVRRVDLLEDSQKQDGKKKDQPVRVVVDSNLEILNDEVDYKMFNDGFQSIIYHSSNHTDNNSSKALNPNLRLVKVSVNKLHGKNIISPTDIIEDLRSKSIHHIMVEGGPATALQFLRGKVVDRAILIRAPVTFIEPVPSGMTDDILVEAGLVLIDTKKCGDDVVEYWVRNGEAWPTADVTHWPH